MKKGMFYLLPLLALSQVATSTPHPQVGERTVLVSTGIERVREAPASARIRVPKITPRVVIAKPVTARPPIYGRNNRASSSRAGLVRRN